MEAAPAASDHLVWMDSLKGMGILMVVAAHIYSGFVPNSFYLFHMPLFFFISGYLLKPKTDYPRYWHEKSMHLLVPYVSFLCLIYPIQLYEFFQTVRAWNFRSVIGVVAPPILGGKMLAGPAAIFWFVTCLFFTQQTVNYMVTRMARPRILAWMGLFLAISYVNAAFFPRFWLPLGINIVFAAAPIFYCGYLYRQGSFKLHLLPATVLAILSVAFLGMGYKDAYNMKDAYYGIPGVSLVCAIAWIILLIAIAKVASNIFLLSSFLQRMGAASMVIMFMHQPIQVVMENFLGVHNESVRFLSALAISYISFLIFKRFRYTSILFLGFKVPRQDNLLRSPSQA
jgi:fucose 4-O-acetylase-like acetyltransferase